MAKVSRAAVSIALSKGRITAERNGSMNPKRQENAEYLKTSKRQRRQRSPGPGGKKRAIKKQKPTASTHGRKKRAVSGADSTQGRGPLEIDGETYGMAELRKLVAQADKEEQGISIRRGELVERADVHRVFAHLYAVHSSQLKTLADKLGPDVAAAFKLTDADTPRIQEIMSMEMLRALSQIKREMNDYLESIGNGGLEEV